MSDLCWHCNKNKPGSTKYITFSYRGLRTIVLKKVYYCEECTKKEIEGRFEKCGYIFNYDKELITSVNWDKYSQIDSDDHMRAATSLLVDFGFLSHDSARCYEIVGGALSLNPRLVSVVYFTRLQDAADYAKAKLRNTLYGWEIRHIDKTISKEKLKKCGYDSSKLK